MRFNTIMSNGVTEMNFSDFHIDGDKIAAWEDDVMNAFMASFPYSEDNADTLNTLIEMCERELQHPHSWLTTFAARTALINLKAALEDLEDG